MQDSRSSLAPSTSSYKRRYVNSLTFDGKSVRLHEQGDSNQSSTIPDQTTVKFTHITPYHQNESQTRPMFISSKSGNADRPGTAILDPTVESFIPRHEEHQSLTCANETDQNGIISNVVGPQTTQFETKPNGTVHPPNYLDRSIRSDRPPLARLNIDNTLSSSANEFCRFLIKKDLILSRLNKYNDNPMHYMAWKLSFKGIMTELDVSPTEELDLLIRYLGPDSSKQASTLRAYNAGNPDGTVRKIWERLDLSFGAPEKVESFLKQRIVSFPVISNVENSRLYELADLVSEISSVKSQTQYATVFSHFDSSTGVNALVSKLPRNLQDKWTNEATRYKRKEKTAYPPFTFFHDFIHSLAEMTNDPSFNFGHTDRLTNQSTQRKGQKREVISARKTDTTVVTNVKENTQTLMYPMHKTAHSLNDCNTFRKKPLSEWKKFILTNGICFKL